MYFRKLKGLCALPAALPLFLFLCCATAAHAAGQEAGTVVSVTPGAFVERDGQRMPLEAKAAIYAGDVLVTDATGRLRAWMRDETTLSLGSDTEFEIEAYDDTGDKPVFTSRMTGLARMLTGKISKANPEGFRVATPQATVGIRGTILSVRAGGGKTTVFVENTLRQVVVNGVTVPSGSKAEVPAAGAAPRVSPMTPADRQELGASLAARGDNSGPGGGAGGASSGVMAAASSSAAPAAAASAPAGLNVDNMLADSSSALSQAIALHQEATVTG
ncbi:FecR family protein, partial [uncultured Desulfovibrio sp.]|uniref:FecR family protein n=1 Tax=uncultured Desulfovibrio sp. TaxID=167968 RepID=UPI00261F4F58